jgi:hypothetical protein
MVNDYDVFYCRNRSLLQDLNSNLIDHEIDNDMDTDDEMVYDHRKLCMKDLIAAIN